MNTNHDQDSDVIELGAISAETKGPGVGGFDDSGHRLSSGLSDD